MKDKKCDDQNIHMMMFKHIDNALGMNFNIEMKEMDLTKTQNDLIWFIKDNPGKKITQKDIEEGLKLKNPTITGVINRMEEKGFVTRRIDENNKKYRIIELTPKAHEKLREIKSKAIKIENRMSEGMTREEKNEFNRLLDLVLYNLEKFMEEKKV